MTSDIPSVRNILITTISITRFNCGEARKIFDEVSETGPKIVLKNNVPIGVVISPEQYEAMVESLEDFVLFFEAEQRMNNAEADGFISSEKMLSSLGIHESDLEDAEVKIG